MNDRQYIRKLQTNPCPTFEFTPEDESFIDPVERSACCGNCVMWDRDKGKCRDEARLIKIARMWNKK